MTFKEGKYEEILEIVKELYGDMTDVTIRITGEDMVIDCSDRAITGGSYSMFRLDGSKCNKLL